MLDVTEQLYQQLRARPAARGQRNRRLEPVRNHRLALLRKLLDYRNTGGAVNSFFDQPSMSSAVESTWYVFRDGQQFGPFSDATLRDLIQDKRLNEDDYVWCPGFPEWVRLGNVLKAISLPGAGSRFQYLRAFIRLILRYAAEPISLAKKIGQIVSRPAAFAEAHIKEEPRALFAAIKFYLKLFALAFGILLVIGPQFSFLEGSSQIRELVKLVPQVGIGFLVLFLLLHITRNRVPVSPLFQMFLYVEALYLFLGSLVATPLAYVNHTLLVPEGSSREVDIFTTEFGKCLSGESFIHWLLHGDLQYFLYSEKWQPWNWMQAFIGYFEYVIILPFAVIFARMVATKFKCNFLIAMIAALAAFATPAASFNWIEDQARTTVAVKSNCSQTYVKTVVGTYSADRIARQLEYKLTNEVQQSFGNPNLMFRLQGNDYVFSLNLRRKENMPSEKQIADDFTRFIRTSYCGDRPYWVAVRTIKYNVAASVSLEGWPIFSERVKPEDCATIG